MILKELNLLKMEKLKSFKKDCFRLKKYTIKNYLIFGLIISKSKTLI